MSLLKYNEESANNAGIGQGVSESGAYLGFIFAQSVVAGTGSKGIEFTLRGQQDCNYLTCYYAKKDGSEIRGGLNTINAIMGLTGVQELSERPAMRNGQPVTDEDGNQINIVPELNNKEIGLVLQKTLYSKDGGGDGYKFDIIMPFNARTRQTMQEMNTRSQPQTVDRIIETLKDKDERRTQSSAYGAAVNNATANRPTSKFDQVNQNNAVDFDEDDIPW